MNISDIKVGGKNISITGVVVGLTDPRAVSLKRGGSSTVIDATIVDETGEIVLSLWDQQSKGISVGAKIELENAYVNTFRGKNSLMIGKFGKIKASADPNEYSLDKARSDISQLNERLNALEAKLTKN